MCQRKAIESAARKALKNVDPKKMRRNKPIQYFLAHKDEMLDEVEVMLKNETYTFGPMHSFVVYEPKERLVHCPPFFPDRILHHLIVTELAPIVRNNLIRDVYGALEGRGISQAFERMWQFVKGRGDWYFVSFDIRKCYPTLKHEVLKDRLAHLIKDKRFLSINYALIDSHSPGIPIGNGTSVEYLNIYLSIIDHYAKEQMRIKYYIRFADNTIMIVRNKAEAHKAFSDIAQKIGELGITIKNNVRIAPVDYGIDFIGGIFYSTHIMLRPSIKKSMVKQRNWLMKINAPDELFKRKMGTYLGWCDLVDGINLVRTVYGDKRQLFKRYMEHPRSKT